jgi:ribosomal-protein-alanine N-acetyltransferase
MEMILHRYICANPRPKEKEKKKRRKKMNNSVNDGGAGPYSENIVVCEADEGQLLDIVSLGEKIFKSSWNEQMVATSMYGVYDTVLVALDADRENKVVGYCIFTAPCEDCELLRIAVAKKYRHQGIARKMIDEMVRICIENNGENIFLEVRESNDSAIALYEATGFEEISKRKDYYKDPAEDAIIMKLEKINGEKGAFFS